MQLRCWQEKSKRSRLKKSPQNSGASLRSASIAVKTARACALRARYNFILKEGGRAAGSAMRATHSSQRRCKKAAQACDQQASP
jgi:hypothetical protein